jgi:hypothetical protein
VGRCCGRFGEADLGADADGLVAEGLGDVAFADADRAVDDDRLAGVQPARRGRRSGRWAGFGLAAKSNGGEGAVADGVAGGLPGQVAEPIGCFAEPGNAFPVAGNGPPIWLLGSRIGAGGRAR